MKEIIVFAKAPIPGEVKTRFQPHLSGEQSAELMKGLLEAVLLSLTHKPISSLWDRLNLACTPTIEDPFFEELHERFHCERTLQGTGDLGERMLRVLRLRLQGPQDRLILLGADAPTIPSQFFLEAFQKLEEKAVVLGPSQDGGYVLLGLSGKFLVQNEKMDPRVCRIFSGISWGTSRVFQQTLRVIKEEKLGHDLLAPWRDVDRPEDLGHLYQQISSLSAPLQGRLRPFLEELRNRDKLL